MLDLLLAALLAQLRAPDSAVPDPCHAAGQPERPRPGCPDWQPMANAPEGAAWFDPASVRRDGQVLELETRVIPATPYQGVASFTSRTRMDCAARTDQALTIRAYDAEGRLITEGPVRNAPVHVPPGSGNARLLDRYCPPTGG